MTAPVDRPAAEDSSRTLLRDLQIHTGERLLGPGWIALERDRILGLGEGPPPESLADLPTRRLSGRCAVPGFVDIHCHGGGGSAFAGGAAAAAQAAVVHRSHGTAALMASLVTDTAEAILQQVRALRPAVASGEVQGIHLEGPWLSARRCGAHPPELMTDPDPQSVDRLLEAADGTLCMVTLAPERRGALEAIRRLVQAGVVVAVGHTDATYAQTQAAIEAGATVATHLHNGQRPPHHREPGPAIALLEDGRVSIESIVDGVHLHPTMVRRTAAEAGRRWVLVSDAMAATGAPDGRYRLGTLEVEVTDAVARLRPSGVIAGSTLTLDRAVAGAVAAGVAPEAAIRAATSAPADAVGWAGRGRLAPGRRADLVLLDDSWSATAVARAGRWSDAASEDGD